MSTATMSSQHGAQQKGSGHHDGGDTVHCNDLNWFPLAPKVWIKLVKLVKLVPETGAYPVIVRSEKRGLPPRHRHVESAEIYVIRGNGTHPQTGHFSQGDYVSERKGAVHDQLVFEEEVEMLMISNGPSMFIDDEGRDLFLMDIPIDAAGPGCVNRLIPLHGHSKVSEMSLYAGGGGNFGMKPIAPERRARKPGHDEGNGKGYVPSSTHN